MATDKNAVHRWAFPQHGANPWRVSPWITTDMGDENGHTVTFKPQVERHFRPDFGAVDVAVYTAQRLECLQFVDHLHASKVTRMPDFITFGEMLEHARVEKGVGVGKQADSGHDKGGIMGKKLFFLRDFLLLGCSLKRLKLLQKSIKVKNEHHSNKSNNNFDNDPI